MNELTAIDLPTNGTPDLDLTYDAAGNLRIEDRSPGATSYRYTHDLWNRLVKIEIDDNSTWESVAEYEYGTHWRSAKRSDTTGDQSRDEAADIVPIPFSCSFSCPS